MLHSTIPEGGLPLYLGTLDTGSIIVLGNSHYLDGRRMELWNTSIVLVGEQEKGHHVKVLSRFPSYELASRAYNLAATSATFNEAKYQIDWVKNEHCIESGDWVGYILHFDRRISHAHHYVGCTNDLSNRIKQHRSGGYACNPLVRKLLSVGGDFTVALTRNFHANKRTAFRWESHIKKVHKNTPKLCPLCKENRNE